MINRKRAFLEAGRLTAKGRVGEAYAVVDGAMRGLDMTDRRPSPPPGEGPSILDRANAAWRGTPWGGFMDGLKGRTHLREIEQAFAGRLPEGARFEARDFGFDTGNRIAALYVPANLASPPALVVMLHGCTQTPTDFAIGTGMNALAERHGFLVLYPGQTKLANASRCWNWFSPENQERDGGETAIIAAMTRAVAEEFAVDTGRIFAAGLSAGGSEAAILGATHPDLFAAVGVHSGLPWRAAHDVASAFAGMRQGSPDAPAIPREGSAPRMIVFHGDRDATVHPANAAQVFAQALGRQDADCESEEGRAPGGRRFSMTRCRDESGRPVAEQWTVHGSGHAWSGGSPEGSHTDPDGPDASAEMVRFFLD